MKNKRVVIIPLIVLVALFIIASISYKAKEESNKANANSNIDGQSVPYVRDYSVKFGKNKNNVTIVEFIDPFCVACARFSPAVKKVLYDYNDEIQLVIRYLTFQSNIPDVIKILEASREQNLYQETLEVVFATQNIWGDYKSPKPNLIWNYIVQIPDMNVEKLREDMKNPQILVNVKQDIEDAKALGVEGTPTLFVNGIELESLSHKALNDLVEEQIVK